MVAAMIKKLVSSIKLVVQVLKNLLLRPFRAIRNRGNRALNAGRYVTKLPGVVKKLPKILKKKPEKREDYFDWGSIYVAKSLVLTVAVVLIVVPLLVIFVIAPLCVRWWGVKDFHFQDEDVSSYTGRVCIYYDADEEALKFEGRLKKGKAVEYGEEYHESGRIAYAGEYIDGRYGGEGILYREDGTVLYRGEFLDGRYEGQGELIDENGDVYSGTFVKGKLAGDGNLVRDGILWYAGSFEGGLMSGEGKIYHENGAVRYSGLFDSGALNGQGMEYYESGVLKYHGEFLNGQYHGNGILYSKEGIKLYSGAFEKGTYNGDGTLFSSDGSVTVGSFSNGQISGAATRTYPNGTTYEGTFSGDLPHGSGVLTDLIGTFTYTGGFLDGDMDHTAMLLADTAEVSGYFSDCLTTQVDEDCFYLVHTGYGLILKCQFADADRAAYVSEMVSCPLSAPDALIISAADIVAPSADRIYTPGLTLPDWIAGAYGIDPDYAVCYAAAYGDTVVYHWVDRRTGKLLVRSAESTLEQTPPPVEDPSVSDGDAMQEIQDIFDEFGLDISDFGSLGFE